MNTETGLFVTDIRDFGHWNKDLSYWYCTASRLWNWSPPHLILLRSRRRLVSGIGPPHKWCGEFSHWNQSPSQPILGLRTLKVWKRSPWFHWRMLHHTHSYSAWHWLQNCIVGSREHCFPYADWYNLTPEILRDPRGFSADDRRLTIQLGDRTRFCWMSYGSPGGNHAKWYLNSGKSLAF